MRRQWKRNAVVATVLLFVGAAVYLNWRYAGDAANDVAEVSAQQQTEKMCIRDSCRRGCARQRWLWNRPGRPGRRNYGCGSVIPWQ